LAFYLSHRFATNIADQHLSRFLDWDSSGLRALSWSGIMALTYLRMSGLGYLMRSLLDRLRLTSSDRTLGFLLGCAKGVIIVAIALQVLVLFHPLLPGSLREQIWGNPQANIPPSQAAKLHQAYLSEKIKSLIPDDVGKDMDLRFQELARK
jgi:uncharacterized membrane protein required for colicin V production